MSDITFAILYRFNHLNCFISKQNFPIRQVYVPQSQYKVNKQKSNFYKYLMEILQYSYIPFPLSFAMLMINGKSVL